MKKIFLLMSLFISFVYSGDIQRGINLPEKEFNNTLLDNKKHYPKLWEIVDEINKNDVDIYITYIKNDSPGRARGNHSISMNYKTFFHGSKSYPEGRLVVVMLHEYGHILFNRNNDNKSATKADREYAAFKYSVKRAVTLADNGYMDPIHQLMIYLPLRLKQGKKGSPHNVALKRLTKEKLWLDTINKYGVTHR
jgi:hypothetical protein